MSDHPTYRIGFTRDAVLTVNGTPFPGVAEDAGSALDWALEQITRAHAALPNGTGLRVEIDDSERADGGGKTGVVVPYGVVLTGDQVRGRLASTGRASAAHRLPETRTVQETSPAVAATSGMGPTNAGTDTRSSPGLSSAAYEFETGPLWPPPHIPSTEATAQRQHGTRMAAFASDRQRVPYEPKEPLPALTQRRSQSERPVKRRLPMSNRRKISLACAVVVVLLGILIAVKITQAPQKAPYARVCVNNLSYQRLSDSRCSAPTDPMSRWWWVSPRAGVPGLGEYVDQRSGSFTAPTESGASTDRSIPATGRPASPSSR